MNENSPKKARLNVSHIATAVLFLIVVFVWRDLARTKSTQEALLLQSRELAAKNQTLANELSKANSELDFFKTGNTAPTSSEKASRHERKSAEPVEEPETLFLQPSSVVNNDGGLTARFRFEPAEGISLPEQITLVVRVPGRADAKILSLKPVSAPAYSAVEFLVNAQGSLGLIEGSPADMEALEFELTVSAPAKVLVRGSKGIKDFEMDISPSGCVIRKL